MSAASDIAAAAAVLACEAARQHLVGASPHGPPRDAPGELENLHRWFYHQLDQGRPSVAPEPQPEPEPATAEIVTSPTAADVPDALAAAPPAMPGIPAAPSVTAAPSPTPTAVQTPARPSGPQPPRGKEAKRNPFKRR